jgi:hopanoid C-3 methylase
MRILLVRPISPNERFGLGPFFKVEPLGIEYVAAGLRRAGHEVAVADLRYTRPLERLIRSFDPKLVGISCTHTVDVPGTLDAAAATKRIDRSIFTLIGGHAAAAYPAPLRREDVDAICVTDGEIAAPALVRALETGTPPDAVPGFLIRGESGEFAATPESAERASLDEVSLPARDLVAPLQRRYRCVHKSPLWAVETTRGCPYRCSFCSIWRLQGRSFRCRSVDAVATDLGLVGPNVFIVDDLFWHPRERSQELVRELRRRHLRKDWILVQARLDTVARNWDLLEAWRPIARHFDIFFGFESPTDTQLQKLSKDMSIEEAEEGIRVARRLGYGVTGNFVVDPDWEEADFEAMWAMVDRLGLHRSGYTLLTPLPGTPRFDELQDRIVERDLSRYDMHHILYEPKLGRARFFELFVKSWRRNVLSSDHSVKKWLGWFRELDTAQAAALARVLYHTQRMLRADAYLEESFPLQIPARIGG